MVLCTFSPSETTCTPDQTGSVTVWSSEGTLQAIDDCRVRFIEVPVIQAPRLSNMNRADRRTMQALARKYGWKLVE